MRLSTRRAIRRWLLLGLAGLVGFVLACNRWVINSTDAYVYTDWALMPDNEAGIVLGTSRFAAGGGPSQEFAGRIRAAAELYKLGKVRHLIVSGANPDASYNEPRWMWRELVKAGVPENKITMDFAGFRTLDSIVRANAVFGLTRFTVISQKYHAYRAVFIAKKLGLSGVAYVAPASNDGGHGLRHPPREVLARCRAVLDVLLLNTQPKFLGAPQHIELMPEAEST